MPQSWSVDESKLLTILRPLLTLKEIKQVFEQLGIDRTEEAISCRSRRLRVKFIDLGEPAETNLSSEERRALRAVLDDRRDRLRLIDPDPLLTPTEKAKQTNIKKSVLEGILKGIKLKRAETPRTQSISTVAPRGNKESLCVLLSDFHMGREVVNTATQETEYNLEIGEERILQTADLVLDALPNNRNQYDEVVMILAGDHVDGENIYRSQPFEIEEHVVEQLNKTVKAVWSLTTTFASAFPSVRIVTARGNHGRTDGAPEANWDNVLFRQLEVLVDITNKRNISIKNRYGEFNTVNVKGHKGLVRHVAPVQADTTSAKSKYGSWFALHEWDFMCIAHWHHWGVLTWQGKPIFRNGSIIGGDPFAETLAAYDPPTQLVFGITESKLPTMIIPILY